MATIWTAPELPIGVGRGLVSLSRGRAPARPSEWCSPWRLLIVPPLRADRGSGSWCTEPSVRDVR